MDIESPATEVPEEPGAGAAALALLAVCARLGHDTAHLAIGYQFLPSPRPVAFDIAVRHLLELPKPVRLRGNLVGSTVEIDARPLPEGSPERAQLEQLDKLGLSDRDPLGFLRERYGGDISLLRVACLGGGLVHHVQVKDVEQWALEYDHEGPGGWGADFADGTYPSAQGATAADVAGCAAFVKLSGGGGTIQFLGDPPWALTPGPPPA